MIDMTELQDFLSTTPAGPYVSLYLPRTAHQDVAAVQLELRHLMTHAQDVMAATWPEQDFAPYAAQLAPLFDSADRITGSHGRGLGVLTDGAHLQTFELDLPVHKTAMVTARPQILPLVAELQLRHDFDLLALQRDQIRLYHHDHDELVPVDLPAEAPQTLKQTLGTELRGGSLNSVSQGAGNVSYHGHNDKSAEEDNDTRRFFQAVDTYVADHYSKPNNRPLVLMGLTQTLAVFREISRNPYLSSNQLPLSPSDLTPTDLARAAAALRADFDNEARHELLAELDTARSGNRVVTDLGAVIDAVLAGNVARLLLQAGARINGRLVDGAFDHASEKAAHNNLLSDLAEQVLKHGGTIIVLPEEQLGEEVAAIVRYAE